MKKLLTVLLLLVFCTAARAAGPGDTPKPQISEQEFWEILNGGKTLEIMGALMKGAPLESRDAKGTLTQSYALLRLMIDQRNMPGGLRGYSLYYFQKLGLFKTTVSRQYQKAKKGEEGTTAVGDNRKWKLEKLTLTDLQKAELDECYADMMRFVREHS